jgi:hypothetical protein
MGSEKTGLRRKDRDWRLKKKIGLEGLRRKNYNNKGLGLYTPPT